MLSARIIQLLIVGCCLYVFTKYMQFMLATLRGLDRMMERRFFDVGRLTDEIRQKVERRHGPSALEDPSRTVLFHGAYLWLCRRLRRVAGLDSRAD